jgi:Ca-activated chloride channel family protein
MTALRIEDGQSAIIDAVYLAVQHVTEHQSKSPRRHALVLFTDGEDRMSYYTEKQLSELLRISNVQIFPIGLVGELSKQSRSPSIQEKAERLLKHVAKESGGRVFFPKDTRELGLAMQEVAHDLHIQYRISYESSVDFKENFRTIEVRINKANGQKLTAVTRPGYYVNPPNLNAKDKKKSN